MCALEQKACLSSANNLSPETSNGPHKAATVTALKPYINLAVHSEHCLMNCHFFKLLSPHHAPNPYLTSPFRTVVNLTLNQREASVQCCHGQLHIYSGQLSASEILGRLSHYKLPMSIAINPPPIKQNGPPVLNNHHFSFQNNLCQVYRSCSMLVITTSIVEAGKFGSQGSHLSLH